MKILSKLNPYTNNHANKLECLTDDDDFGRLETCKEVNGACAKGIIG